MDLKKYLESVGKFKDGMTFAELEEALKEAKLESGEKVEKSLYDKTASDLAKAKKALAEKQTDEEKKKTADDERDKLIAELEKKVAVAEQTEAFVKGGYDAETAKKLAQHAEEGEMDKFISEQVAWAAKQKEIIKASITEELMKGQNPPRQGTGDGKDEPEEVKFGRALAKEKEEQFKASEDAAKSYFGGH